MRKTVDWEKLAKSRGFEDPKQLIIELYYNQNLGDQEISDMLGISRPTFQRCLKSYNLPAKGAIPCRYMAGPPCPKCGSTKARTVYSKAHSYGFKRIKICRDCKNRFITVESVKEE